MIFRLETIEQYEAALAIIRAIEEQVSWYNKTDDQNITHAYLSDLVEEYEDRFFPICDEVQE